MRNIRRSRRLSSGNERSSSPVLVLPKKRTLFDESANANGNDDKTENGYSDVDEIESLNSEIFKDFS